ncbi:dependent RNA helicase [Seminavis robusta]|uniref:ATP-dependent RNA helicase n=1 Tax=Seminavis robusta TaxID=568900 RepID=A0A9N8EMG0_9STRA|nr:dependent RNA helicase [Seminavis robusta]|eukprot:Sro1334_g263850.1 dependent RNA helicase (668) ;mRNA; f:24742-26745
MSEASPNQKRRRGRGKRGGRKNKKRHLNDEATPTTSWSALERDWFAGSSASSDDKIPDPLTETDVTDNGEGSTRSSESMDTLEHLRHLWVNFCKKRQRPGKQSQEWQPRPIQLQAWSILMPPNDASSSKRTQTCNMIGLSPTASGKTLAFGAPMVIGANLYTMKKQPGSTTTIIYGIVLVPTRELALQVAKELEAMVSSLPQNTKTSGSSSIRVLACCGGGSQSTQDHIDILKTKGGQHLISATPGRLADIMEKLGRQQQDKEIIIRPRYLVMDECDRLAGNVDLAQQVTAILNACMSPDASLAFFSATYPQKVQETWKEWMQLSSKRCAMIRVDAVSMESNNNNKHNRKMQKMESDNNQQSQNDDAAKVPAKEGAEDKEEPADDSQEDDGTKKQTTKDAVKNDFLSRIPAYLVQTLHVCSEHKKPKKLITTLDRIRKEEQASQYHRQKRLGVVFFGRIKTLQYMSNFLKKQPSYNKNYACLELHSQLPQHMRNKNMQTFQSGRVTLLLATDIAARGLHVSNIGFVINYDFPGNLEQYVHRCGRAGRDHDPDAGRLPPTIYSFFTRSLAPMAPDVVSLLEACKAWVDPNLLALVNDDGKEARSKNKPKHDQDGGKPASREDKAGANEVDEEQFSDEDAFPELSAQKIVLKRASNVSDASSSSGDDSD